MAHVEAHRVGTGHSPRSIDWRAAFWAAVVGGLVFAGLEMAMAPLFAGMSPWAPLHMIAAIVLGPAAMARAGRVRSHRGPSPPSVLHMVRRGRSTRSSSRSSLLASASAPRRRRARSTGSLLYFVNFYFFTRWFPWFPRNIATR